MPFTVYLFSIAVFAQGTSEFMLAGLLPDLSAELDVSVPQAGLLTSAFAVGMVFGAPLTAAFSRGWPPRRSLAIFLLVFIAVHLLGAITTSFTVLLASRVVAALANAGFLAVALSLVTRIVPTEQRNRALSIVLAGTTIALIAGVPAGAFLAMSFGWRSALWAVALISVPGLLAVLSRSIGNSLPAGERRRLISEFVALRNFRLLLLMFLALSVNAATFCGFSYLAPLVTEAAKLPATMVPLVLALFGIGALLGVLLAGRLALRRPAASGRLAGALLAIGWSILGSLAAHPTAFLAMFLPLTLLLGALSFGLGSALIARFMAEASGAPTMAGAFATMSFNIGAALGPVLGGLAFSSWLGAAGPALLSAGFVCLALLTSLVSTRRRQTG
ncbi:Cmx/CmrA family chloramphenicol efflux MFS transporter [Psychromicrobium lacuslunae]|uniref:Major facilitator superfamily (MFS) profile domain-containing protein n=1 Tax=Psychromicrobium lacuslunae TaxID=1618207 RepID=A0A0D4C404_9MICC|nr:hypothetical protein UM93_12510 [Psychromicrobium lacuslunae]